MDAAGQVKLCDFGSAAVQNLQKGKGTEAAAGAAGYEGGQAAAAAAAVFEGVQNSSIDSSQVAKRRRPQQYTTVGTDLFQSPQVGNLVTGGGYDADVPDSYAAAPIAMSLLLGGFEQLEKVAQPVPQGVSMQKFSTDPYLHAFVTGMAQEQQKQQYSAELRDFVGCCVHKKETPNQLLQHCWLWGKR